MNSSDAAGSGAHVLRDRLRALQDERSRVLTEVVSNSCGDDADRATNVDAQVRLAQLDKRIADVQLELSHDRRDGAESVGIVRIGSTVTVDLGDGPETYLLGSIDYATTGSGVITPDSPLGRALLGATAGTTVSYEPRSGVAEQATVLTVG